MNETNRTKEIKNNLIISEKESFSTSKTQFRKFFEISHPFFLDGSLRLKF